MSAPPPADRDRTTTEELPRSATGGPRWLDQNEREAWLATAAIMISLPAALDTRLQQQCGLSLYEYMVMSVLSEQSDLTMRMTDIADGVSSSLSRLSHVVTRLEGEGLVSRARVPGSGRRTTVTLTGPGLATVVAAAPHHVKEVRELFIDALTPGDCETLRRIGREVALRIDPERPFLHGSRRATP